jgi:hypothetical protein
MPSSFVKGEYQWMARHMHRLRNPMTDDDDLRSVNARHTILTVLDHNKLFASTAGIEPRFYG